MTISKLNNPRGMKFCGKTCAALAALFVAGTPLADAEVSATYIDASGTTQTAVFGTYGLVIENPGNIRDLNANIADDFPPVDVFGATISGNNVITGNGAPNGVYLYDCVLDGGTWTTKGADLYIYGMSVGTTIYPGTIFNIGGTSWLALSGDMTIGTGTTFQFEQASTLYLYNLNLTWNLDVGDLATALISGGVEVSNGGGVSLTLNLTRAAVDELVAGKAALQLFDVMTLGDTVTDAVKVTVDGESLEEKGYSFTFDGGKISVSQVPEPSAFGLLAGLGALALVASRRRRRKA